MSSTTDSVAGAHFSDDDGILSDELPARQGEHNEEILKELGCTDSEIKALKDSGALIDANPE
jgi:crotonobetainyl-CoA:carnitine CoA-transferase CaiB-like acyl-CoA transferase